MYADGNGLRPTAGTGQQFPDGSEFTDGSGSDRNQPSHD
jgi:hypothetical protein